MTSTKTDPPPAPQPKIKDLPLSDRADKPSDPKGGRTPSPTGPVPIPYPN